MLNHFLKILANKIKKNHFLVIQTFKLKDRIIIQRGKT